MLTAHAEQSCWLSLFAAADGLLQPFKHPAIGCYYYSSLRQETYHPTSAHHCSLNSYLRQDLWKAAQHSLKVHSGVVCSKSNCIYSHYMTLYAKNIFLYWLLSFILWYVICLILNFVKTGVWFSQMFYCALLWKQSFILKSLSCPTHCKTELSLLLCSCGENLANQC